MRSIDLVGLIERRRSRRLASAQHARGRLARAALGCGAFVLLVFSAALLFASLAYVNLVSDLPSPALLPDLFDPQNGALAQPTRLYDRTGEHLLLSLENPGIPRRYLSMDPGKPDHFSAQLVRVTLAVLDAAYWGGPGFSLKQLTSLQPVTIPERLVDELLLWEEPSGLRRALRMRILAAQAVHRYGHVQVLEWYLNSAYYGHLAFGADSAARLYLDKPASSLDLGESALLVAASQSPALNPLDAPAGALERQQELLDDLLERGVITADELRQALVNEPLLARPLSDNADASPAAAFTRLVLRGLQARFGSQRVERGGLRIITTLDYSLQLELSCLTRTQLARLTGRPDDVRLPDGSPCVSARLLPTLPPDAEPLPSGLTATGTIFDPQTGQVLALLGDTNRTGEAAFLTPRPPGSLLTPFAAVTSFARGASPASLAWDIPSSLPEGLTGQLNPDGAFHGPTRLRVAIANDYLAPQAQMLDQVGASNVWRLAGAFGLSSLASETNAGLIYAGGQVSPLEIAQAYGVFASQGQRAGQRLQPGDDLSPATVLYVEDFNRSPWLDLRRPETQSVVTAPLSYLIHDVLSDVTARWPSLGNPNPLEIGRPAGAKIGHVAGGEQVWVAGYTPQRVAVFWLGLPGASQQLDPRAAAGIWHAMMQYIHQGILPAGWNEPPGIKRVEVCHPSGLLPTTDCPEVVTEIFLEGSQPTAPDMLYQVFQINRETGRLATVFTPAELIEDRTYFVPPPQARDWAVDAQLPVPPADYDAIQPPSPSPDVQIAAPRMFDFVRGVVVLRGTADGEGFQSYQVSVGRGLNPDTWLQVGESGDTPVTGGTLATWDTTGGTDGLYAVRLQVIRQDQTVETATIQVTVDNNPPLVRIPYPVSGQEFRLDGSATITFQAQVADGFGIQRLEWLVDGEKVGETMQPPYAITWPAAHGNHILEARAYDLAGAEGRSELVPFRVEE